MTQLFREPVLHLKKVSEKVMSGRFDFDILDHQDRVLATVREPKQHLWKTVFRNVVGVEYSARHFMHVDGTDGEPLFAIDKHNELLGASASIQLPNVGEIGRLNMVNKSPIKAHFQIVDARGGLIADLPIIPLGRSTFIWNFRILDPRGIEIGEILQCDPRTGQPMYEELHNLSTLRIRYELPENVRIMLVASFVAIMWFDEERILS
jgi:hypothetical protein